MASGKEPFTWRKEALPQRESAPRLVCVVLDAETAGEKARSTFLTTEQVGSSSAHLVVFISSIVFQDRYSFGTDVSGSQYRCVGSVTVTSPHTPSKSGVSRWV